MENPDFLRKVLKDYGAYLRKNFKKDIRYQQLENNRRLINSIRETVSTSSFQAGTVSFALKVHGRFQDMGAGAKTGQTRLEDLMYPNAKKKAKGKGRTKISRWGRKKHPWYNKNIWGTLNRLIPALTQGYIDFSVQKTKTKFKNT